jgi:hypothetical protein
MAHSIYSPLRVGQVITPSEATKDFVWKYAQNKNNEMLTKGLLCEHAHNEVFKARQWRCEFTVTTGPYDRIFNGLMQDDKLATILDPDSPTKVLCSTHNISPAEFEKWDKSPCDVIVHSFEEVGDDLLSSRYCGAISFWRLQQEGLIRKSKFEGWFFNRRLGLKVSDLMLE